MSEKYWEVKRSAYAAICITPDFHGTAIVWTTLKKMERLG